MQAVTVKKGIKWNGGHVMKPGELYVFSNYITQQVYSILSDSGITKHIEIEPIEKVLSSFPEKIKDKVVIIRTGGIGDLVALSSLVNWLIQNEIKVHIHTQEKYFEVFNWFETPVELTGVFDPLAINNLRFRMNPPFVYKAYEGVIEKSRENWFDLIFSGIDVDLNNWGRPSLRSNDEYPNRLVDGNILLCLKASSTIRSIEFKTIWKALEPNLKNRTIYLHDRNVSKADRDFINKLDYDKIKILKTQSLGEFINDVYWADQVISVDTAALHIREGLGLPAIGLYNAFTSECRTKYYKFTKSYDIKSHCEYQPCFQHSKLDNPFCKNHKGNENAAPCFDNEHNDMLHKQLAKIFEEA